MSKDTIPAATAATPDPLKLLESVDEFGSTFAKDIAAKTKAGLTREQALNVIKAQIRHDAELAAKKAGGKA
ncbi:MAG: hypothetical protein WC378_11850 [Opitutaceae bacterium]|jgi:NurA-like 5'-3' nuclease